VDSPGEDLLDILIEPFVKHRSHSPGSCLEQEPFSQFKQEVFKPIDDGGFKLVLIEYSKSILVIPTLSVAVHWMATGLPAVRLAFAEGVVTVTVGGVVSEGESTPEIPNPLLPAASSP